MASDLVYILTAISPDIEIVREMESVGLARVWIGYLAIILPPHMAEQLQHSQYLDLEASKHGKKTRREKIHQRQD